MDTKMHFGQFLVAGHSINSSPNNRAVWASAVTIANFSEFAVHHVVPMA